MDPLFALAALVPQAVDNMSFMLDEYSKQHQSCVHLLTNVEQYTLTIARFRNMIKIGEKEDLDESIKRTTAALMVYLGGSDDKIKVYCPHLLTRRMTISAKRCHNPQDIVIYNIRGLHSM